MSIHCLCYEHSSGLFETFSSKFLARRKNMYPLGLVELFCLLEVPGNRSDVGTPQVLIYMDFKFHELWLMPKVSSNSLCV